MEWFIALVIIGFLVYAAGRETRFGGLGLLWRVAVGFVVFGIIGVITLFGFEKYQNAKWEKQEAAREKITAETFRSEEEMRQKEQKQFEIIQASIQRARVEKEAAKEAFQLKWGYSDALLQQISRYKLSISPILNHGMVMLTTLKGEKKFLAATSYCDIHGGDGCSIYGDNRDGHLWLGKDIADIESGTDAKEENLVWLIDSVR